TIGKSLATHLKLPFLDIDQLIIDKAGADIPWIFDVEGEDGFRKREQAMLQDVLCKPPSVISTGGGIVNLAENRLMLRKLPGVIYLSTSVEQQFARTAKDKNRPLLQTANPKETLAQLLVQREPFYREVSSLTVSTDHNRPRIVVDQIIEYWKSLS
ncbi:MAG: shikimate kinase, partial [Pseudomonadales bacterium]|nr:shikimate kinase [Pseudomonadales bacterium]